MLSKLVHNIHYKRSQRSVKLILNYSMYNEYIFSFGSPSFLVCRAPRPPRGCQASWSRESQAAWGPRPRRECPWLQTSLTVVRANSPSVKIHLYSLVIIMFQLTLKLYYINAHILDNCKASEDAVRSIVDFTKPIWILRKSGIEYL